MEIVGFFVPAQTLKLFGFRWHEEFKHQATLAVLAEIVGEFLQTGSLALIQMGIALGIIAHQHLTEGGANRLNMSRKVGPILEIKLLLATFFRRTSGDITAVAGVGEDGVTELFIDKHARLFDGDTSGDGGFKSVVNHQLSGGDFRSLRGGKITVPAEHLRLKRASMVEGENIKRLVVAD